LFSVGEKFNADTLRIIPPERLFCETDESDLTIEEIYSNVAEALGTYIEALAVQIEENVRRVFPLVTPVGKIQQDIL